MFSSIPVLAMTDFLLSTTESNKLDRVEPKMVTQDSIDYYDDCDYRLTIPVL